MCCLCPPANMSVLLMAGAEPQPLFFHYLSLAMQGVKVARTMVGDYMASLQTRSLAAAADRGGPPVSPRKPPATAAVTGTQQPAQFVFAAIGLGRKCRLPEPVRLTP